MLCKFLDAGPSTSIPPMSFCWAHSKNFKQEKKHTPYLCHIHNYLRYFIFWSKVVWSHFISARNPNVWHDHYANTTKVTHSFLVNKQPHYEMNSLLPRL
jgi:hypothetical protein